MTLQILTNRDFQLFVLMNFFQVREKDLDTATEWGHRMWFVLLMGTCECVPQLTIAFIFPILCTFSRSSWWHSVITSL